MSLSHLPELGYRWLTSPNGTSTPPWMNFTSQRDNQVNDTPTSSVEKETREKKAIVKKNVSQWLMFLFSANRKPDCLHAYHTVSPFFLKPTNPLAAIPIFSMTMPVWCTRKNQKERNANEKKQKNPKLPYKTHQPLCSVVYALVRSSPVLCRCGGVALFLLSLNHCPMGSSGV